MRRNVHHNAYVISQPFPVSGRPGFQAICPSCGVLDHDSRIEDAQSVADHHSFQIELERGRIEDYVQFPIKEKPIDLDDLRRRQRDIEEALR